MIFWSVAIFTAAASIVTMSTKSLRPSPAPVACLLYYRSSCVSTRRRICIYYIYIYIYIYGVSFNYRDFVPLKISHLNAAYKQRYSDGPCGLPYVVGYAIVSAEAPASRTINVFKLGQRRAHLLCRSADMRSRCSSLSAAANYCVGRQKAAASRSRAGRVAFKKLIALGRQLLKPEL